MASESLLPHGATIFVTGASGFIGSAAVKELVGTGYAVVGLARSDKAAAAIDALGAKSVRGSIEDLDVLAKSAAAADGVVHLGFIHDFSKYDESARKDAEAIRTMGTALAGSNKPLITAAATTFAADFGRVATEADMPTPSREGLRQSNEVLTLDLAKQGVRSMSLRLSPSVHGPDDAAFLTYIIECDRKHGVAAYPTSKQHPDGTMHWTGVHVEDAAVLIRLALERGQAGTVLHAAENEGFTQRELAEVIGEHFSLPVKALEADKVGNHFSWLAPFLLVDAPVSSDATRKQTGWSPSRPTLFEDVRARVYDHSACKW